ncbi:class I adenylate-forming enzyme family protein [Streptomyces sp. NBC_00658]|uniref:class I adenylate-forming enzyme family protein n=1 Tax=Streptomyces sp. NBC_00658 TaxID=2975800 RepID=UPI003249E51C
MSEPSPHLQADSVWELVCRRAAATPGALLVVDERRRRMTFAEFRDSVERVAAGLAARGVGRGTVVSWQLPSWIETIVLFAALSRLGAVQNPLIMMLREPEVEFICRQAGSRLLIVPESFRRFEHGAMAHSLAARLPGLEVLTTGAGLPEADPAALPPEPQGPEARWLFYTSGTTAAAKGAKHTDEGLLAAARTFCTAIEPTPDDRIAALAPLAHVGGVLHVLAALMAGSALIINDVFEPAASAELLRDEGVTLGGSGVPFLQGFLREQRARPRERLFPSMRAFLIGGAPRHESLHYETRDRLGGAGISSGYGLTECPFLSWGRPDDGDHEHATADGQPGPETRVRIVRADGTRADAGEIGELWVRAPQLTVGYVDSGLDKAAFDAEGFFRTGDLASLDGRGYLTITGRLKDVIIRNMENVSAREVEDHLLAVPGLADATVIGLPDPDTGERVCAVVVPVDPASPPELGEICAHLRARGLNTRRLPVQLEILAELPRNAMGKVVKTALRERFLESAGRA